jgi:hypothetical protein
MELPIAAMALLAALGGRGITNKPSQATRSLICTQMEHLLTHIQIINHK